MENKTTTLQNVREYYGKVLNSSNDLKTNACCTSESLPKIHREILAQLEPEVVEKFYGCGSPIPHAIAGKTVLDLGCGSGRDVYLASKLVGENGTVIGVDMTDEQLAVAQKHIDAHTKKFGYVKPNVAFRKGYIENLAESGIENNSIDVIISNCVINLSPAKEQVFREIFRVLKPGGELYFADVFSGRRVPEDLQRDPVLYGECLAGALYTEDFRRLMQNIGFTDFRTVSSRRISIDNKELEAKAGMIDFYSQTIRAFKLDSLEDICEDYGQVAIYKGTLSETPHSFALDDHHLFETGKAYAVCGNTAAMLEETRFGAHFQIIGDRTTHYGPFDCSDDTAKSEDTAPGACC